jgi:Uma2 family endonuclease
MPLPKEEYFTYADYAAWPDDVRYELIDGVPYMMSSPTRKHQRVAREIGMQIENFLDGKLCEVFRAPLDVRLNADGADDTVVQPDILVVCDESKQDERGVKGAPDWVVEILSQSTNNYDSTVKLGKYMKAGVKECWLVDTENCVVRVHVNKGNGQEEQRKYDWDGQIPVSIFPDFAVDMAKVMARI